MTVSLVQPAGRAIYCLLFKFRNCLKNNRISDRNMSLSKGCTRFTVIALDAWLFPIGKFAYLMRKQSVTKSSYVIVFFQTIFTSIENNSNIKQLFTLIENSVYINLLYFNILLLIFN